MLNSNINDSLVANGKNFYFDYKNGKYGYNTSSSRGADTFVPFSGGNIEVLEFYTNMPAGTAITTGAYPNFKTVGTFTVQNSNAKKALIVATSKKYMSTGYIQIKVNDKVVGEYNESANIDSNNPQYLYVIKTFVIDVTKGDVVKVNATSSVENGYQYPHAYVAVIY